MAAVAAAIVVTIGATAAVITYACPARRPALSVDDIRDRLAHEHDSEPKPVAQEPIRRHPAPHTPFTVAQAHRAMQLDRHCSLRRCARKRAALRVLVAAGHATPAPEAEKYLDTEH